VRRPASTARAGDLEPAVAVEIEDEDPPAAGSYTPGSVGFLGGRPRCVGADSPPDEQPLGSSRDELHASVGVEVSGGRRHRGRRGELLEARGLVVDPAESVSEDAVRRFIANDDHVRVAISVEIRHDDLTGRRGPVPESGLARDRTEAAIAVVVQQLVGAVCVDAEEIEVPVVVCVDERSVHRVQGAVRRAGRFRDVLPGAFRHLAEKTILSRAAEVDVEPAVVIVVSPECSPHVLDRGERMRALGMKLPVRTSDSHRIPHAHLALPPTRKKDEIVDAVGIEVRRGRSEDAILGSHA
jgi:hypothetical protein